MTTNLRENRIQMFRVILQTLGLDFLSNIVTIKTLSI